MSAEVSPERFLQYEAALEEIARRIQDQIALEEHQQRSGFPWSSISLGRSDTYKGIAGITSEVLGRQLKVSM